MQTAIKGRGSSSNPSSRFDKLDYSFDEGEDLFEKRKTEYLVDSTQTILASNNSPDVCFNYSINPYRGCEHGCIYCFARPTHEYLGFSAGLDFETKILVKKNAAALLRKQLSAKSWKPQTIVISGVTDCYQPIERELKITRSCLEVLAEFKNPVGIITKNALITRDIDILSQMKEWQGCQVNFSVTSLDSDLARILEPRTSMPQARLDAIRSLTQAGIPVNVLVAPLIPALNDSEIPKILEAVAEAGAISAGYVMLRLPYGVKDLFVNWLEEHYPDRKDKVLHHLQSMREGKLYQSEFGERMRGKGKYAEHLDQLFQVSVKKFGLNRTKSSLSADHFQIPTQQLNLF